ncbi:hypothetical protein TNCV_4686041 [Trichonephila clavipes]|nr:hypothetical protein TNCV_4686041 [Trichonephila clavipes]
MKNTKSVRKSNDTWCRPRPNSPRVTLKSEKSSKNKKGPLSELRLGKIVLIGDYIKKRMHWPLAKVIWLIPGKNDPNDSSSVLARVSRHGRVIKAPEKLDLINQVLCVFESK